MQHHREPLLTHHFLELPPDRKPPQSYHLLQPLHRPELFRNFHHLLSYSHLRYPIRDPLKQTPAVYLLQLEFGHMDVSDVAVADLHPAAPFSSESLKSVAVKIADDTTVFITAFYGAGALDIKTCLPALQLLPRLS